jgi:hypothetical protein
VEQWKISGLPREKCGANAGDLPAAAIRKKP